METLKKVKFVFVVQQFVKDIVSSQQMLYYFLRRMIDHGFVCFLDKRDDLTKEAFVDGWFLTGDIGRWNPVRTDSL